MAHSGKTMTFATDLLPKENNTYSLGDSNQAWKIYGSITGTINGYSISASVPTGALFTDHQYDGEKGITLSNGKFGHTNTAVTATTTQAVYPIKIDSYGHITAYGSAQTIVAIGTNSTSAAAGNHAHGNIANAGTISTSSTIASGDAIVISTSANSGKISKMKITFDASTTTQVLSKAGTWVDNPDTKIEILDLTGVT